MIKITLLFFLLLYYFGFSQQNNLSRNSVIDNGLPSTGPFAFQFSGGTVGGLDSGSFFSQPTNFDDSRWWSIGSLPTGTQTVFGLRFQLPKRALTFGYRDIADVNPRIEWISSTLPASDLEFRTANSFTSTSSKLLVKIKSNGTTVFGEDSVFFTGIVGFAPKIGITQNNAEGGISIVGVLPSTSLSSTRPSISIFYPNNFDPTSSGPGILGVNVDMTNNGFRKTGYSHNSSNTYENIGYRTNIGSQTTNGVADGYLNTGFLCRVNNAGQNRGVYSQALSTNSTSVNYGVYGEAGGGSTSYAIYGTSPTTNANFYAGYFNGKIFSTGSGTFGGSDAKLKEEVKQESEVLNKLKQLRAINFKFKENKYLNFPTELQHGFIAQELEKIFPELVTTIKHPILEKASSDENVNEKDYSKEVKYYEFKAVNYSGLISVLTSAVQELDQKYDDEFQTLKKEIENLKKQPLSPRKSDYSTTIDEYEMSQNIPNPFDNQSIINYTLPKNEKTASIAIFDFNGKYIKEFKLTETKGSITISSEEIGKGIFLYSLITNNEPIISKKMIIR